MLKSRRFFATLFVTALLGVGFASPASAQQAGLVNVDISNVLNNNNVTIAIPINAAANICGVDVNILAQMIEDAPVDCRARGNQNFTVRQLQ